MKEERAYLLEIVEEAVCAGARQSRVCGLLGISERCLQRWRKKAVGEDKRKGPNEAPANKLSQEERQEILKVSNQPEYRDLSPKQIVPRLADKGIYIASESSFYRVLREHGQLKHRERSRPTTHSKPKGCVATGPNQVYSWD